MIERHREPCQLCGAALYYAEQWQSLCRACADANGITRLCDNQRAQRLTPQQRAWLNGEPYVDDVPNCRCYVEGDSDLRIDERGDLETFHGIDRTARLAGSLLGSLAPDYLDIIRREIADSIERDPPTS